MHSNVCTIFQNVLCQTILCMVYDSLSHWDEQEGILMVCFNASMLATKRTTWSSCSLCLPKRWHRIELGHQLVPAGPPKALSLEVGDAGGKSVTQQKKQTKTGQENACVCLIQAKRRWQWSVICRHFPPTAARVFANCWWQIKPKVHANSCTATCVSQKPYKSVLHVFLHWLESKSLLVSWAVETLDQVAISDLWRLLVQRELVMQCLPIRRILARTVRLDNKLDNKLQWSAWKARERERKKKRKTERKKEGRKGSKRHCSNKESS